VCVDEFQKQQQHDRNNILRLDKSAVACRKALSENSTSEAAALLLSEALAQGTDTVSESESTAPLIALLNQQRACYPVLARLIELFKRAGRLKEALPFIDAAEKSSFRRCIPENMVYIS
jgi:hypothetical protein